MAAKRKRTGASARACPGKVDTSHSALDALDGGRTVDHVRGLLVERGILPPWNKYMALLERWMDTALEQVVCAATDVV